MAGAALRTLADELVDARPRLAADADDPFPRPLAASSDAALTDLQRLLAEPAADPDFLARITSCAFVGRVGVRWARTQAWGCDDFLRDILLALLGSGRVQHAGDRCLCTNYYVPIWLTCAFREDPELVAAAAARESFFRPVLARHVTYLLRSTTPTQKLAESMRAVVEAGLVERRALLLAPLVLTQEEQVHAAQVMPYPRVKPYPAQYVDLACSTGADPDAVDAEGGTALDACLAWITQEWTHVGVHPSGIASARALASRTTVVTHETAARAAATVAAAAANVRIYVSRGDRLVGRGDAPPSLLFAVHATQAAAAVGRRVLACRAWFARRHALACLSALHGGAGAGVPDPGPDAETAAESGDGARGLTAGAEEEI